MEEKKGWRLLTKRNVLGGVLIAGIVAGLYLGDLWKGLGGGNTPGVGISDGQSNSEKDAKQENDESVATVVQTTTTIKPEAPAASSQKAPTVIKVVIADRSYFIRTDQGDTAADLAQVVELARAATGDIDGIKIRVYRKPTSRAATEFALSDALLKAGMKEEQVVWIGNLIED